MSIDDYERMIELLKSTTLSGKLEWEYNNSMGRFYTYINECKVELQMYYDASMQDNKASLNLFNKNGQLFASYYYYSQVDGEDYRKLRELEDLVRDNYYKITESENLILKGLENL